MHASYIIYSEEKVVINFEVKMGDRAGSMSLCIPFNVIEPLIHNITTQDWFSFQHKQQQGEQQDRLVENLKDAKLQVRAYLAQTTIKVSDLLSMEPGDVLKSKKEVTDDLILQIEGKSKFAGKIGQFRDHRAFHITRQAKPAEKI